MKARFPALEHGLGALHPADRGQLPDLGPAGDVRLQESAAARRAGRAGGRLGFLVVLTLLGGLRELLGAGTLLGARVMPAAFQPWVIMVLPGGAFLTLGMMMGAANAFVLYRQQRERRLRQAQAVRPVEEGV
jgi:Na+-translocating ferredoxin:NAD+ oxidoreductase subunit E